MKKIIAFLVCMSIVYAVFAMTVFATTEAIMKWQIINGFAMEFESLVL